MIFVSSKVSSNSVKRQPVCRSSAWHVASSPPELKAMPVPAGQKAESFFNASVFSAFREKFVI
jgi:hypothetical protein